MTWAGLSATATQTGRALSSVLSCTAMSMSCRFCAVLSGAGIARIVGARPVGPDDVEDDVAVEPKVDEAVAAVVVGESDRLKLWLRLCVPVLVSPRPASEPVVLAGTLS